MSVPGLEVLKQRLNDDLAKMSWKGFKQIEIKRCPALSSLRDSGKSPTFLIRLLYVWFNAKMYRESKVLDPNLTLPLTV